MWRGTIVEESLKDRSILSDCEIIKTTVTDDSDPADHWHVHTVSLDEKVFDRLAESLKDHGWYAHFWNEEKEIVAIFPKKMFRFHFDDKAAWRPAIEHGLSLGIPKGQLDFLIS